MDKLSPENAKGQDARIKKAILSLDTFHQSHQERNEVAHRFAIEYHKSLRGKKEIHSILDDISGIGPKRRLALMRQFGDINAIREATVAQLADVEGMNERAAESVYEFFHSVVYKTDTN